MDNGASSYRRFLDGDDSGIVELIRDYKDGLMLYLNGLVQNLHTAEDLMEETFVRLAVRRPVFRGKSSFRTWLYAIGRNLAVDELRRHAKLFCVSPEELPLRKEEELLAVYLRDERKRILHGALKKLHADYRQVLWLIYFEEFDHAQTAEAMGKSKRQIENLVYRAKQSLRAELEKEGFTNEVI